MRAGQEHLKQVSLFVCPKILAEFDAACEDQKVNRSEALRAGIAWFIRFNRIEKRAKSLLNSWRFSTPRQFLAEAKLKSD